MRPDSIVVASPCFDEHLRLPERREDFAVEQLVPELRIQALADDDRPGYYGRKSWDMTPEQVYNRIVNPSMLIWLAEAAGVEKALVERASGAALAAPSDMSAQSAGIRREVPWHLIADGLR